MFNDNFKIKSPCPICGHESTRNVYCDEVGVTEEYFNCPECGYYYDMCYSKPVEGIRFDPEKIPFERQFAVLRAHADKLQYLIFEVSPF